MNHFLDIIIPEYDCKEEFMKRLLHSISRQKNVNFEEIGVIIVNDKSKNKLRKGLFKNFPRLNIEYYYKDTNDGVGLTRQYGFDKSNAQYVTFVDQDDELYGNDSLGNVISYLKNTNLDVIATHFVEEVMTLNKKIIQEEEDNTIRMTLHGVFLKSEFLRRNDIRFIPGIRVHDDYYIRMIIDIYAKVYILNIVSYLWKYNGDSQVRKRRDVSYYGETFDEFFYAIEKFNEKKKKANSLNALTLAGSVMNIYVVLESSLFDYEKLKDKKEEYEEKLYSLICEYSYEIELARKDMPTIFDSYFKLQQNLNYGFKFYAENDIFEFIKRMGEKYPNFKYEPMKLRKKLDIIVPYFNPNFSKIESLLSSIIHQTNISLRELVVTFVSDKSEIIIDENKIKTMFPNLDFNFYYKDKNEGQGLARQYGLERSKAEYVTFIDQDDIFFGPNAFNTVFDFLSKNDCDALFTDMFRYDPKSGSRVICNYKNFISLHGLFFKTKVLNDNGYKFDDKIWMYEDLYFVEIVSNTLNCLMLETPTYIWIINEESQTFKENQGLQLIQKYPLDYINATIDLLDFIKEKGKLESSYFLRRFFEMYFTIESELFVNYDIKEYEKMIYDFYLKYEKIFNDLPKDEIESIQNKAKEYAARGSGATTVIKTFESFIEEYK